MRQIRRALVLGAAGFVGTHLTSALLARGAEPVLLDSNPPDPKSPGADGHVVVSPVNEQVVGELIRTYAIDTLFHLAGSAFVPPSIAAPRDDLERNAGTTLQVLEAVRASPRPPLVAYVSSAAVYGNTVRVPVDEDHPLEPVSPYGVSKLASEAYVAQYHRLHGLEGFSARPFSLYGPLQRKLVVHDLIVRALNGEDPLEIAAPAEVTRDYVYGPDAAVALVRLAEVAPARGEAYNLATGVGTTLTDLAQLIVASTDPGLSVRFTGRLRAGDPIKWIGDSGRARQLGASFPTDLRSGIATTARWLSTVVSHDDGSLL